MSPNPTSNRVRFQGDPEIVKKLMQFIKPVEGKIEEHGCCKVIDFERILPCPDLEEFQSRTSVDRSRLTSWIFRLNDKFQEWWYPSWQRQFDWQMEHWGCCNVGDFCDYSSTEDSITFLTIDPPIPVITLLSSQFPTVTIIHEWYDQDHFGGMVTSINGQATKQFWMNEGEELKALRALFGYDELDSDGEELDPNGEDSAAVELNAEESKA